MAQLYLRTLRSLSVAPYDSLGYGGYFRTRLHTSFNSLIAPTDLVIISRHGQHRKHGSFIVACIFDVAGKCSPSCCPEAGCITSFIKNPQPQQRASIRDSYTATGLQATISFIRVTTLYGSSHEDER
jgi:hypothetical protein